MSLRALTPQRGLDALLAALWVALLGWTTWCLGGYRPETMAIASPANLLFTALVLVRRAGWGAPRACPVWAWVWPLPFLGYAAVNAAFVSPVPWLGWLDWLLWLHLFAAYWTGLDLLSRPVARWVIAGGIAAVAVGAVGLAVYQRVVDPEWLPMGRRQAAQYLSRSGGPFGIPNSLAAVLLLLIPPVGAVVFSARRRGWVRAGAVVLAGVLIAGLALTVSRGAWLSFVFALAAAPLLVTGRSWVWRAGAIVLVLTLAGLAAVVGYRTVPVVKGRLDALRTDRGERTRPIMWRIGWELFRDAPGFGTGAGSYRVLLERHRPENFKDSPKWAHNDYLNTLSDYGVTGFALACGGFGAFLVLGRRRPAVEPEVLGLELGLLAFGLSLFVDFHLKIPAIAQLLGAMLAAWGLARGAEPAANREPAWWGRWAAVVGAAALLVATWVARPRWAAEGVRYAARQQLDELAGVSDPERLRGVVEPVVADLRRATVLDPANAHAWSDLAFALSQRGHYSADRAELATDAERAAREALRRTEAVPEFWVNLGIALDLQDRWVEAGACFTRALKLAPHHQLMWYYQAYHLSLRSASRPLARAAIGTCLRLDPGNPAAEALRDRLQRPR